MGLWEPEKIVLLPKRIEWNEGVGRERYDKAIARDATPRNGNPTEEKEALRRIIISLHGEAACMLYLNKVKPGLKWHFEPLDDPRGQIDLDDFIDVKTSSFNHYRLVVQPGEPDEWAYVHATVEDLPCVWLHHWCWGREAKERDKDGKPLYWEAKRGKVEGAAHFVSNNAPCLKPMSELRKELVRRSSFSPPPRRRSMFEEAR
jgi:hypothetical protein